MGGVMPRSNPGSVPAVVPRGFSLDITVNTCVFSVECLRTWVLPGPSPGWTLGSSPTGPRTGWKRLEEARSHKPTFPLTVTRITCKSPNCTNMATHCLEGASWVRQTLQAAAPSPPQLWLTRVEKPAMCSSCRLLQRGTDLTHSAGLISQAGPPKSLCGNHLWGKMFTQVCAINISHVWSWDLWVIVHICYIPVGCEYWVWSMFTIIWRVINVPYISASSLLCDADFTQRLFSFLCWNVKMWNNSWLIWF